MSSSVRALPSTHGQSTVSHATQETALQLDALHKAQITYTKKIEAERLRLHQIEKKTERTRNTIMEFNRTLGGDFMRKQRTIGSQKLSTRNESLLQTAKEKRDKLQHRIKMLAVDIDNKRREKMQHERVQAESERHLVKRRGVLARLNRELEQLEEDRATTGRQCELLKSEIVEEMEQFNDKVSATHSKIVGAAQQALAADAHAQQAPHHSGVGGKSSLSSSSRPLATSKTAPGLSSMSAVSAATASSPSKHGGKGESFVTQRGGSSLAATVVAAQQHVPEVDLQQEVNKAYWVVAKTRMDLTKQIERKEELYSAFDKICSETGVANGTEGGAASSSASSGKAGKHPLEKLVPLLLKSEEENYLVFRTINELNVELEQLELEKIQLERSVEDRANAHARRAVDEAKIKFDLGLQRDKANLCERKHEDAHHENEADLTKASEAITGLFSKLGCEDVPLGEALLASGLTERNVEQFLGLIEDQLVELLQLDSHMSAARQADDPTRPKTPKFTKDGKRLPAMLLPDLLHNSVLDSSITGADDETDDGPDDGAQPIDPSKWLHSLKSGIENGNPNFQATPTPPASKTGRHASLLLGRAK